MDLTDFLPLYSDARTGRIVVDDDNATPLPVVEPLPELKSGDILVGKKGFRYRVRKITRPRRDTGYQEPLFRLSKITEIYIEGNMEFTLDELQAAGMKLEE